MKEQLKRAAQALEADAAVGAEPATADADGGGGAGAQQQRGVAGKAQQRAKKADDYHARHHAWVAEFNELTGGECAGGEGGVKWAAVRAWQQKHWQANNLLADGLIGPKTIEAAKIVAKKSGAKSEKPEAKEGGASDGKEKQNEAPQPGLAEGAEAAADKPKMDEEPESEADEKVEAEGDAKLPAPLSSPAKSGTHATAAAFEAKLDEIDKLIGGWKPPEAQEQLPQTALAKANGKEVKDPTKEATPHGAMMSHLSEYRSSVKELHSTWGDMTMGKRAATLTDALNAALNAEKVFPVDTDVAKLAGHDGHFEAGNWTVTINETKVSKSSAKPGEIDEAASDIFHEGKHAEQRFSVARLLAGTPGMTPPKIATETGIDPRAAQRAMAVEKEQPLAANSPEKKDAEAFLDDTVTHGTQHEATERLAKQINVVGPQARALFDSLSPHDQQALKARWEEYRARMFKIFDAYQRLAVEKDAFAAEKELGLGKTQ